VNVSPGLEGLAQIGAALAYLLASVGYGAHLTLRTVRLARLARYATILAVSLHTIAIGAHCAATSHTPLTSPAEMLSASGWAIALIYLFVDLIPRPAPRAIGAVALPVAFLCLFAGAVLHHGGAGASTAVARMLDSRMVSLHVFAVLFAFGLLVLAFACAALYLVQNFLLKRKRLKVGLFGKLPPLASVDNLAFTLVAFAFPLLTISIISGVIQASGGAFAGSWTSDPKVLASFALWLVYGGYLALHVLAHWRGTRANYLLIGGLLLALVTYFVPSSFHRFG
jgi:ABC-type uncharacterized transport system permease subunit